jgi:V/A-type H+-transporting ATPase subunit K
LKPLQKSQTEEIMDPSGLAAIGAGLAVGLAAIGTGIAQSRIGAAGLGALAEKPEMLGQVILLIALPETMVILGFAVAAMVLLLGG